MSRILALGAIACIAVLLLVLPVRTLADEPPRRVVLIQTDAVRPDLVAQFLADGTLPANGGFATLSKTYHSQFQTVVTPSLTTPNLTAMVTGVYPQKHGAISNIYPLISGAVTSGVYGHQQPLQSEGLWSPALRAGRKVGLIRTVGVNDNTMTNTWTLNFHVQAASDKVIQSTADSWHAANGWNLGSFSANSAQVMTFTLQDDASHALSYTFNILALDPVAGNYSQIVLDADDDLTNGYFGARPQWSGLMSPTTPLTQTGNWTSVIFTSTNTTTGLTGTVMGAYLKLYEYSSNPLTVSLYSTGVWYNPGYSRAWVNTLYQEIGPFPRLGSQAGSYTTDQDRRDFNHRENQFFLNAALNVLRQPDWDMVITYQGIVDSFQHAYLLTDPRQLLYTDPISVTYWNYIKESYQAVDTAIVAISNTVGLAQTDIFVSSDHGQAPVHTALYINRLMAHEGISVTAPITAYAQAGGGYAFVYINTIGRIDGVISPIGTGGYTATQNTIVTALTSFTDTDRLTGATAYPFESVIRKQDLAAQGLNIETAGDVYASVLSGYILNGATTPGPITSPIASGGTHGYNPAQPAMHGVFLAAGPHISRIEPRPTRLIDVAPTILDVLGVEPLSNADGVSLKLTRWRYFLPIIMVSQ